MDPTNNQSSEITQHEKEKRDWQLIMNIITIILLILSAGWHVKNYLIGPETSMLPIEQVMFYGEKAPSGIAYLYVVARLCYINQGEINYNDIVSKEYVSLQIGAEHYLLNWKSFVEVRMVGTEFKPERQANAHAFIINAKNAVSHETKFIPQPCWEAHCQNKWQNYLKWSDFLDKVTQNNKISLSLHAVTYKGEKMKQNCTIEIVPERIKTGDEGQNYYVGNCYNEE